MYTEMKEDVMTTKSNRVDNFHKDQVWESPRGTIYKVESVARGGHASLKLGFNGEGKRHVRRNWDAVSGWFLIFDPKYDTE